MKVIHRNEQPIPEDLRRHYEKARAALESGVAWDGSIDSITYLTQGEAIAVVGEFLDAFEEWLKSTESSSQGRTE